MLEVREAYPQYVVDSFFFEVREKECDTALSQQTSVRPRDLVILFLVQYRTKSTDAGAPPTAEQ